MAYKIWLFLWQKDLFLHRAWESLKVATCCKSLVIVYNGVCLIQIGMAAESLEDKKAVIVNTDKLMQGSVYRGVMKSKARKWNRFLVYVFVNIYAFIWEGTLIVCRELLGKSFSLSWEIRAAISACKYTGLLRIENEYYSIELWGYNETVWRMFCVFIC